MAGRLGRGYAAAELGCDLFLKARRAENESASGCRADLVDNGIVRRLAEQAPIGFAARVQAAAEPHVRAARRDQMARLAFGVDPVARPFAGMARHAGAERIERDGAIASQPMRSDWARQERKAPFRKRAIRLR